MKKIKIGDIFIDKHYLILNNVYHFVEIFSISESWGFPDFITYIANGSTLVSVSLDSFNKRFQSITEVRDEKLTKILN